MAWCTDDDAVVPHVREELTRIGLSVAECVDAVVPLVRVEPSRIGFSLAG